MTLLFRWRRHLFAIAWALALYAPGHAADKPQIPIETFFRHPALLDAKLSPSGRYLGMTSVRDDKRVVLLVVDLLTNTPARVLAYYRTQDVVDFSWVSDDRLLFRLGQLEPDLSRPQVASTFSVDVEAKRPPKRMPGYAFIDVPAALAAVKPNEVIVGKPDPTFHEIVPQWLDTTSGLTLHMDIPKPPERVQEWWFNSRGEPRVALSVYADEERGVFHWLAPGTNKWRELASFKLLTPPFELVGVSDDDQLYVAEARGAAREAVLTTFDFSAGRPASKPVVQAPGFDFKGYLLKGEPGNGILGVRLETDTDVTVWIDPAMKQFQAEVDDRFAGQVNNVTCRLCGKPDMVALVHSYSDHDPGRYVLYRARTGHWEDVVIAMPDVDPKQMASVDFQRIRARDGREIPLWLTLPSGTEPGKPAPTVMLPHGGPWMRGGHWVWEPMAQFLASRGYLVISPEFRGSAGYGETHLEAGFKQWGLAMQDDLADALVWARQQGLASDRACIAGASYGGYATLMGLVRHHDLYRCGIAWAAPADLLLTIEGSSWYWDDVGNWWRRHALPTMVGDVNKDAIALKAVSPLVQAARIRAPLLLAYGEEDVRVPMVHGKRLRDAMIEAGNAPEWVLYPNEGHGWQHLDTRVDFAKRVEAFLDKHLRQP